MALNPDEYEKGIIVEDLSASQPLEFTRRGYVRPLATQTSQDLEEQYQR